MTFPSRPAPPPPQRTTAPPSRYTPTTDWDFCSFDSGRGKDDAPNRTPARDDQYFSQHEHVKTKKPPPPRPPPPKLPAAPTALLKKTGQPQSINILSSLFGQKRFSSGVTAGVSKSSSSVPVKLLPPPAPGSSAKGLGKSNPSGASTRPSSSFGPPPLTSERSATVGTAELISFDSPPSSPTFTQKSCSDCISVDSFSSDSNYSSPNNGHMSQAESGFEDDFVVGHRVGSCIPWVEPSFDPFDVGSMAGSRRAPSAPPPVTYVPLSLSSSSAQIRTPLVNSKLQQSDFVDPLCNGRNVQPKAPTVSMPTIIKPPSSGSGSHKSTPSHSASPLSCSRSNSKMHAPAVPNGSARHELRHGDHMTPEMAAFESLPSPPMPSIPPPPPPPSSGTYCEEPYGIALFDFVGETMEDLSFKMNEKIYLLARLNEEWYMGRDRRGLEGMFPVNYVEVKVPLSSTPPPTEEPQRYADSTASPILSSKTAPAGTQKVRALYQFTAETTEDLTLMENDMVTVLYQITPQWLYGEINGRTGQFPSNYIEYVPPNLLQMPTSSAGGS